MFVTEANVADLWNLETIGIKDPAESKSQDEREKEVVDHFLKTVTRSHKTDTVSHLHGTKSDL